LRIAVTVSQAKLQETSDGAFYANAEAVDITPPGGAREPDAQQVAGRQSSGSERRKQRQNLASQRRPQASEAARTGKAEKNITCFECRGYGHYARNCANRRQKQVATYANLNGENSASQSRANQLNPQAKPHALQERRNKKADFN